MRKRVLLLVVAVVMFSSFLITKNSLASPNNAGVDEKLGLPIVVYGAALSDTQKSEVKDLLKVHQHDQVDQFTVNGQDLANYIGGNPHANMYSSVKILHKDQGEGLSINIVTPENITQVTKAMYMNALLTAGVENADVFVASSVKVSGHSALTGIYKAYDAKGVKLDEGRMEAASQELDIATDIAEEGINQDKVSELLTGIKKAIAEQNPATREEIEQIVRDQLQSLNIELSAEDRQRLIDLFEQMRSLNINFDQVRNQLDDLTGNLQEVINDEGFLENVRSLVQSFFRSLSNFVNSLLN